MRTWRNDTMSKDTGRKFLVPMLLSLFLFVALMGTVSLDAAEVGPKSFVGVPARLEQVVLPGPELKVRPATDRRQAVVLRIERIYPHGSDFRYDLVYSSLEPGRFNLCDYLIRVDGSAAEGLPPLPVEVAASLPPGQIEPNALEPGSAPRMGGYQNTLWLAGILWVFGLAAILHFGRRRRKIAIRAARRQLSLSERLQGMVERIMSGQFTESDKSQLEQLLLAYWRKRLNLENARPEEAMAAMRAHHEAAHLLEQLERWLYRPEGVERRDVVELLRPYQNVLEEEQHTQGCPC